jgi:bifunctional non-homologous end joining protein LigD
LIQTASDSGNAAALVFFLFDLLYLDGETISVAPLHDRKERLRHLLSNTVTPLQYSDHQIGRGPEFYTKACGHRWRASSRSARMRPMHPAIVGCG